MGGAPTIAELPSGPAAVTARVVQAPVPTAAAPPAALRSVPASISGAVAQAPVPTAAAAPVTAALSAFLAPFTGLGGGLPLQSPTPWAALAVARRLGRSDAPSPGAPRPVAAVAYPSATTGTTTKITWAWGTNPVLSFRPATDKLDFGWMGPSAFDVTEASGSTKIAIVGNNHSYTLQNVPLAQLTMTNIVANDAGTVSKWKGLIAAAQTTTPTVSIASASVAEGNSGSSIAAFTVTLSKASTRSVTVGYGTGNGTATAGSDYTATSGTLTFAPGVTSTKVNVAVIGDTAVEANETFTVTLSAPSGVTLGNATATGTITNDDTAVVVTPPAVSIANATVAEGNSGSTTLAFNVSLSKASDKTVTVGYSTTNGSATAGQDYTAKSGTLTFAPGTTAQQVSVAVTGDTTVEPNETLSVTLAGPSNATLGTATATGTITNDDTSTVPPTTSDRWGNAFYAPYVDMGGWPVPDLLAISQTNGGGSLFTAAFMQATPDGKLAWAGLNALEPGADNDQARAINRSIKALQAAGGDVMVSLGGVAGVSLAEWGSRRGMTATQLATAYAGVVDTYGINHLDFDIEGAAVTDQAAIALHSQALKILQQSKPDLKVWYTLPVLPTGLTADGIKVVDSALKVGVTLAGVNVMAMDYGESAAPTSGPNAKSMGAYAIESAESTYAQMNRLFGSYGKTFGYANLGVTPMLGVNDVLSEVFTLADAQVLENYARTKGIGMLALWSVTRDTPGPLGVSTYTHSGLSAPAGSFAKILNDYGTVNPLTYTGTGGTGGGTTTPVTGGTTTKIGWNWGSNAVLSFDPAKDKLDFVWMGPSYFNISEASGSTVITIANNNQTYTLSGVALNRMSTANIIALDSGTVAKWQSAISAAVQGATPPVVTAPTIAITNASLAEGNSGSRNLAFTVNLSTASTTAVSVNYATSNGTATAGQDYTAASGTVTFAPGVLSQQVNVAIAGDTTVEPSETLTVTLSNPTGATLATATATGTITNDDTASGTVPPPATALPIAAHDKVLAAYFPEWGIYGRNFQVADIPGDQLTHVIYSFLNVTPGGEVAVYDSFAALEKRFAAGETVSGEADLWYYPPNDPRSQQTVWGNFNQLAQLKAKHPHLKVSIAVGGWTLSGNFSTVTATAAGREKLANSVVTFIDTYRMFDGVDFDWEYPGGGGLDGNSASPNDGANYAELLKLVRAKLDVLEQRNGRQYEISVASPAGYDKIANFNLAGLAPSVDFFNLMSYDFHGTWEKTTGHQSAFTGDANGYDVKTAVGLYRAAGVPAAKIVLGAPLYTRGWSGVADGGDGGYLERATGSAPGTFEAGVYDYKDLVAQLKDPASGWKLYWDDTAQAAYLYNPSKGLFSSFETPTSIAQKSDWAEAIGLGGIMFWDISNDAVGSPDSLVRAAYSSWVLDQTMAAIRSGAPLPAELIIGGDGVIAALPTGLPGGTAL
jgi:chitinase